MPLQVSNFCNKKSRFDGANVYTSVKKTPSLYLDVVTSYWIVFIDFEMSEILARCHFVFIDPLFWPVENVDDSVFLIQGEIEGFYVFSGTGTDVSYLLNIVSVARIFKDAFGNIDVQNINGAVVRLYFVYISDDFLFRVENYSFQITENR